MISGGDAWTIGMERAKEFERAERNKMYQFRIVKVDTQQAIDWRWNNWAAKQRAKELEGVKVEPPIMTGHIIHGHLTVEP